MRFSSLIGAGVLAVSLSAAPMAHAADALGAPTGTMTMEIKSADVGVGYTWGKGQLRFNHRNYPFSVDGATIAAVGFSTIAGKGTVYNLHRVKDFEGTYGAVHGEATLGEGVGGLVLENKNGVRIKIETVTKGARLASSAQGLTFKLK
ncbi:MAG: hypothetical protein ABF990_04730 [Acetobacter sp.]|uniref:hypothetical protein n=1 Tax=Acetobacter sp. TaxID=440 RepID=UPI0039E9B051